MKFNLNLDKDKIVKKLEDIENKLDEEERRDREYELNRGYRHRKPRNIVDEINTIKGIKNGSIDPKKIAIMEIENERRRRNSITLTRSSYPIFLIFGIILLFLFVNMFKTILNTNNPNNISSNKSNYTEKVNATIVQSNNDDTIINCIFVYDFNGNQYRGNIYFYIADSELAKVGNQFNIYIDPDNPSDYNINSKYKYSNNSNKFNQNNISNNRIKNIISSIIVLILSIAMFIAAFINFYKDKIRNQIEFNREKEILENNNNNNKNISNKSIEMDTVTTGATISNNNINNINSNNNYNNNNKNINVNNIIEEIEENDDDFNENDLLIIDLSDNENEKINYDGEHKEKQQSVQRKINLKNKNIKLNKTSETKENNNNNNNLRKIKLNHNNSNNSNNNNNTNNINNK